MKSVVLIDDDLNFIAGLAKLVKSYDMLNVVAITHSGREGMLAVEHYRPDLVIMDIMMPNNDGLSVIKYIQGKCDTYNPFIYVISAMKTPTIRSILNELEVDYVSYKPVNDIEEVKSTLEEVIDSDPKPMIQNVKLPIEDTVDVITDILDDLGVPVHLLGYEYIKTALVFMIDDPSLKRNIYAKVAGIFKCESRAVTVNINNAIKACMDSEKYRSEFGSTKVETLLFLHSLSATVRKRIRGSDDN